MKYYYERLKFALAHAKMRQAALARKIGVTPQAIQKLCKGGSGSSYTSQIAEVLGVSSQWLATGEGEMVPVADPVHQRIMHLLMSAKAVIDESGKDLSREEIYRVYRVVIDTCMDESVSEAIIKQYIAAIIESK